MGKNAESGCFHARVIPWEFAHERFSPLGHDAPKRDPPQVFWYSYELFFLLNFTLFITIL